MFILHILYDYFMFNFFGKKIIKKKKTTKKLKKKPKQTHIDAEQTLKFESKYIQTHMKNVGEQKKL